jgi:hypothetical protein
MNILFNLSTRGEEFKNLTSSLGEIFKLKGGYYG